MLSRARGCCCLRVMLCLAGSSFSKPKAYLVAGCVFLPERSSQGELEGWRGALGAGSVPLLLALLSLALLSARKPSAHTND